MRIRFHLCLGVALLMIAAPINAEEWMTMAVSPRQSFSPTNLRVQVRLQPSADNRLLDVIADSPDFFSRSQIQLEGDRAPRTLIVEFRGVPSGEYRVSGFLLNSLGIPRAETRQEVWVLPSGRDR
jgi:hypothetical protein